MLYNLTFVVGLVISFEILYTLILFCMKKPMPFWLRWFFFDRLLCKFQWYRKWYGGLWINWYIEECYGDIWFNNIGIADRPMSSRGTPIIEDYTTK